MTAQEVPAPLGAQEIQGWLAHSPFIQWLGLTVERADATAGIVEMRCPLQPPFERGKDTGQWHGGPLAAIVDTVGDYALVMTLRRPLPTINFRVDYLKPAVKTAILARATVRRQGKSVGVVDVDLLNDRGDLVAIGRASYATLA